MAIRKTTEQFKEELKLVSPEIQVVGEYINNGTKIEIIGEYGLCKMPPVSLLHGNKPSIRSAVDKNLYFKNSILEINPDIEIIGEYVTGKKKILIKTKYGDCLSLPTNLLCGKRPDIQSAVDKNLYFINQAIEKHGTKYDYSEVKYIKATEKVIIICPVHGRFEQIANGHLSGRGCIECSNDINMSSRSGYIKTVGNKECILYKLRIFNDTEEFYKIGITSRTIKKRFIGQSRMPYEYEVISETKGSAGFIYDLEKEEHRKHNEHKYTPLIKFGGSTECFTILL